MTGPNDFCIDPTRNQVTILFVLVTMSNPNGDPDNGGAPRTYLDTGQGLISLQKFRRGLRDYWELVRDKDILVSPSRPLNEVAEGYESWAALAAELIDAKFFGNPTMKHGKARAPLSNTCFTSVCPVQITEITGTRCSAHMTEDGGKGTMHTKSVVEHGLYRGMMTYEARRGAANGVTQEDLALLYDALFECWDHDTSTTRQDVSLHMAVQFSYPSDRFITSRRSLQKSVKVSLRGDLKGDPRGVEDYDIVVDREGLPDGLDVRIFCE